MADLTASALRATGKRVSKCKEEQGDVSVLESYRAFRCKTAPAHFASLATALSDLPCVLSFRPKRIVSIIRKLRREPTMDLSKMADVIGFRVITHTLHHQALIAARLVAANPGAALRDYVAKPRATGYRAIHLLVDELCPLPQQPTPSKFRWEVQLRTYYQHLWATMSESFGEQAKEGHGSEMEQEYLSALSHCVCLEENSAPKLEQIPTPPNGSRLMLFLVAYDVTRGEMLFTESYGTDFEGAQLRYGQLEEMADRANDREAVLIGSWHSAEDLRITHARYFSPRGVPSIPSSIVPEIPRPCD